MVSSHSYAYLLLDLSVYCNAGVELLVSRNGARVGVAGH